MALSLSFVSGYIFSESATEVITATKLNQIVNQGYVSGISGTVGSFNLEEGGIATANINTDAVTLVKMAANSMDGTAVRDLGDQNVLGSIPLVYHIVVPNITQNIDITVTHKVKVEKIVVLKTNGDGGDGDNLILKNNDTKIENFNIAAATDKDMIRSFDIAKAQSTINAGETMRASVTSNVDASCVMYIYCHRVP